MVTDNVSFNPDGSATFGGGVTLSGVNNTYNFKALATDTDSWFGVYEDANNSANIILTRSDGTVMFKILGHTGVATFAGTINAGRIVTSGLYGTGHSGSILPIWQYNAGNPGYGIGYEESSPDRLRMDVSNNLMSGTPEEVDMGDTCRNGKDWDKCQCC